MMVLLSIVAVIICLLLVAGIHEAGHACMARFFNIKITTISIGFGKPLLKWQGKSCQWVWALWPLGGYVRLLNSRIEPVKPKDNQFCFDKKPVWVRCIILLAGVIANLLMAWIALALVLSIGYQQTMPVIAKVAKPSIAATAGLTSGDRIISFGGQLVPSWREVGMQLITHLGQRVDINVKGTDGFERQASFDLTHLNYKHTKGSLLNALGIQPDLSKKNTQQIHGLSFLNACEHAFLQMTGLLYFYLIMLKQLLIGSLPFTMLLGPLGLFTMMMGSFLQGLVTFLYFIASFSLAVALINILPLPGLDGGSIVYALVEKIRRKPVSVGIEVLLHQLMFIIFCLVLVQLLLNDMQRYLH